MSCPLDVCPIPIPPAPSFLSSSITGPTVGWFLLLTNHESIPLLFVDEIWDFFGLVLELGPDQLNGGKGFLE